MKDKTKYEKQHNLTKLNYSRREKLTKQKIEFVDLDKIQSKLIFLTSYRKCFVVCVC